MIDAYRCKATLLSGLAYIVSNGQWTKSTTNNDFADHTVFTTVYIVYEKAFDSVQSAEERKAWRKQGAEETHTLLLEDRSMERTGR